VLAAVAGFGSAGAMLPTAPADVVALWANIPQDRRWYTVEEPAHPPHDAFVRLEDRWPQLAGGAKHWKHCMEGRARLVSTLLRAFGVEPFCTLCESNSGEFDTHTTSPKHFRAVYHLVEQSDELDMELLWNRNCVVNGRVAYNYLDGEIRVLREVPLPTESEIYPHKLSVSGQWIIVGAAVVVPVQPAGDRTKWPNMWCIRFWKKQMQRAAVRVVDILKANGALEGCSCLFCSQQYFSTEHLLGPRHFNTLMARVPENKSVCIDHFWQVWNFENQRGALAFNHADGTVLMVRRSDCNELVVTALPLATAVAGQSQQSADIYVDTHERILAALRVPPLHPTSKPLVEVVTQPATSSSLGPSAADMQQQSGVGGSTGNTVSPCGKLAPAKRDAPVELHMSGTQQLPVSGVSVCWWFWQQHAAREVKRLEEVLIVAFGSTVDQYCKLCQRSILPSEGFAKHVARDQFHIAELQAGFEHDGPNGTGWVQCWAGVAQFNHLTLDVSIEELGARGGGSEDYDDDDSSVFCC
jgi:hypothetical protein